MSELTWYTEMLDGISDLADSEQSVKMSAYMKNRFPFLGIPKPKLEAYIKPYLKSAKKLPFDRDFCRICWNLPYREGQYIGIEYLLMHQKELERGDIALLRELICTKSWWETVDSLDEAVGTLVMKYPKLKSEIIAWSLDENIWLRRASIDFQLKFKDMTDAELLAEIIGNCVGTGEFFINKAIGWSLREYSKTDSEWVRMFISNNRYRLAPLSVKEASKYL